MFREEIFFAELTARELPVMNAGIVSNLAIHEVQLPGSENLCFAQKIRIGWPSGIAGIKTLLS